MNELTEYKEKLNESISDFNAPFTDYLVDLGLPTTGVLAPIEERLIVIESVERTIKKIEPENREIAVYLTRFLSSVAAGLFDGAVTYLWNETIGCLRKMVVKYDLEYFFKITAETNGRYKNLKDEEDLLTISDFDLLNTCNRMGLITNHVFEVFKFINYMRNHSSAAHPTENEISAYDLLSWLDNCIKYAINAVPNADAIKLQQLLRNIRTNSIPTEDFECIGKSIMDLPTIMVEDLLSTIFGMYTDTNTPSYICVNIEGIAKYVWIASSDGKKYLIGEKYGYFRKNGDIARKDRANDFLFIVDGLPYKDEDSLAYEIKETLANLMTTHNSFNNFYNEAPWAKQLKTLLPTNGTIPESVLEDWVKTIVVCFCGNGLGFREGVDEGAVSYYLEYLKQFDNKSMVVLLNLMDDPVLLMDLDTKKANRRFRKLCLKFSEKTQNELIADAFRYIANFNELISNVHKTTMFKELLAKVNKVF